MTPRNATIDRKTNETEISVTLELDGEGSSDVQTGIGFLDHHVWTAQDRNLDSVSHRVIAGMTE